jgi:hypothetical protein
LPTWQSHPTPLVQSPESALPAIRYVCLDCSDADTQVLGWGRHCWMCNTSRIAPSATIANTRPGIQATELLEHWRHLIP